MIRKFYFLFLVLIFSWNLYADNILPKQFGTNKSKNKCLIYYPLHFEPMDNSEIDKIKSGVFDTRNYEKLLETINIKCDPYKNESFDIEMANIYKFINEDYKLLPNYSIIFFNTHGSEYGSYISFEHFDKLPRREKRANIYLNKNLKEVELVNGVMEDIREYYKKALASTNDKIIIRKKMDEYFKNNKLIENYSFESENPIVITYHIKGISQNLAFQDAPSYIGDSKDFIKSRERYARSLGWELSHKNTFILITDRLSWGGYFKDDLLYICNSAMKNNTTEEKVKYLYKWSSDIGLSKLIVNNLDCKNLIEIVGIE